MSEGPISDGPTHGDPTHGDPTHGEEIDRADGGVTDDPSVGTDSEHADARPIDKFRKTAVGSVVAAGLLGLRDVLEGRPDREEIAIVNDAPTRPTDGPTLVFDEETGTVTVTLPNPPSAPPEPRA